ncbi:MAG: DegV family protein [Lachnospirales bacterium]
MGKNIGIVTDSNSGITQKQGEELGIHVLPMPFTVNGTPYFEDINLSQEQFYARLTEGANIATSQPSPEAVLNLWNRLLERYDELVHIPMSSGLSGSCETAILLSGEYDGRVQVVNNQRISVTQRQSVLDAMHLTSQGFSAKQIKDTLEAKKMETGIYIMVDTLKYLRKGGRITPAAAALGTVLRLKPVLQIHGARLDAFAKARTVQQAKALMINALKNDIEQCFGRRDVDPSLYHLEIAHTQNEAAAMELRSQLMEALPGSQEVYVDRLSLSVSCHIGPGALAVAFSRKID